MGQVVLENLAKTYPAGARHGESAAVRDINLTVAEGEFMVLVGPSGCGKSTALRLIAGLEPITRGTISIGGRIVNDVAPKDRGIAMVFQNYALYPHMTVFENMAFGLKLAKTPAAEIKRRVDEAAAILGLGDLLTRRPAALSGGQRQRVAVGRAIVRHPQVFLFDEPLSNLDAKMRVQMRSEIAQLHARLGATMIYVTHDQTEAMTMGDRICVMHAGRIEQVADPLTLYHHPETVFVAGFIGSPAMNLLRGRIVRRAGTSVFVAAGLELPLPAGLPELADQREVVLGLRPEHITDRPPAEASSTAAVSARIELAEPMGAETYLHFRAGDATLVARVAGDRTHPLGEQLTLHFNLGRAHFFDAHSEKIIR